MNSTRTRLPALSALPSQGVAQVLGYFALYVALAWVSFVHPMRGLNITPWNPQAALAVGLLIWRPRSWWLVWVAAITGEALVPDDPIGVWALVLSTTLLVVGYVVTAQVLRRAVRPRGTSLARNELVLALVIVAAGAALGALLRAGGLALSGAVAPERILPAIHRGAIGDGVGLIVTLPLLFVLSNRERRAGVRAMLATVEWWLIVLVAGLSILVVFGRPADDQFKFFYLLFLPVVWSAARYGVAGAASCAAVVQVTMIAAVQQLAYRPLTVFELQLLVAVLASTGLLLGAIVDEREEAARSLQASLRLAAAGDMAAALAHELNQPLTAMSTYAHALQVLADRSEARDAGTASAIEVSAKLAHEAERAADVVKRLRDFFRNRATELQAVRLGDLLDREVAAQRPRAAALQVRLDWRCEPADATVLLDPVQIAVVVRNLLSNALDAAGAEAGGWVSIDASREGAEMVLRVFDSARGLHGDEVTTVFDRRASDKPGGMGIGLSISRSIIEAHGGKLWADPGPGGRFLFTLPVAAASHD